MGLDINKLQQHFLAPKAKLFCTPADFKAGKGGLSVSWPRWKRQKEPKVMITILQRLKDLRKRQRGASLVEYALLIALIALIAVPSLSGMSLEARKKVIDGRRGIEGTYTAGGGSGHCTPDNCPCSLNPDNPMCTPG